MSNREIVGAVGPVAFPDRDDPAVRLDRNPVRHVGAREIVVCLRRRRSSGRASHSGCSGRARSRCRWRPVARPRRSCRRPGGPPRSRVAAPKSVVCLPSPENSGRASRWGCSGRARSRASAAVAGRHDDLAVGLERHRRRAVVAAEVGRLLAVAGEARVERAVGVVAGEREVASPMFALMPAATILPSAWIATPFASSPPRSRSSACRRRRSSCRACRWGCSGRARSRRRGRRRPTATILPSGWIATPCARRGRRRSRSSACRRRRSSGRACRSGCSGRARSRRALRDADRDDLAVGLDRHPGGPSRRRRSRSSACRRRRSSGRGCRSGCSGRARSGRVPPRREPTATILPSAWRTPPPHRRPTEVGRLLAVAGERQGRGPRGSLATAEKTTPTIRAATSDGGASR